MVINEKACQWGFPLLFGVIIVVHHGLTDGCVCPRATILAELPTEIPSGVCCLNYSGSAFGEVSWTAFINDTTLEILDLSHCNVTRIKPSLPGASQLKEVHLHHNALLTLPAEFLADQPSLTVLDLGSNLLRELPEGFLRGSDGVRQLDVGGNRLRSLPASMRWKPGLRRLELDNNPWDCSCFLVELLTTSTTTTTTVVTEAGWWPGLNRTTSGSLLGLAGNLTCASPRKLAGASLHSVSTADVCRPPGLTALFILLPLLILSALVLCWCCGRKRNRRKETPTFGAAKKKRKPVDQKLRHPSRPADGSPEKGVGILKNQLLLRPASDLLGSTRDVYKEVEVNTGSLGSLGAQGSSRCSHASIVSTEGGRPGSQGPAAGDGDGDAGGSSSSSRKAELDDVVSVSEVLKDSANREKAYLAQSTEYYSLVPGINLEDSDHGEYESVDLGDTTLGMKSNMG